MDLRPATLLATLLATTASAAADCPTDLREIAPTGFLASQTQAITAPGEVDTTPSFEARIGAAGGLRATGASDARDVGGTGGIGGEIRGRRKSGLSGCASADLLDVREGSAHLTASANIPMFFTGMTFGVSADRQIRLPLSARPEFLRAPVDRISTQASLSFLDFALSDNANKLRVLVMPVRIEQGLERQDDTDIALSRRTSSVEAAMFGFVAGDNTGRSTDIDIFKIQVESNEPTNRASLPMPTTAEEQTFGFARFSLASVAYNGSEWGFDVDGGVLSLDGPINCEETGDDCAKGWGRVGLRHRWASWQLDGRVERDAFIAANNLPSVENRASSSATATSGKTTVTASVFAADTKAWLDGAGGQRAGVRASLSQDLGHGFSGQLDSEVVRSNSSMPELASGARFLLSLAWAKQTAR